MPHTPEPWEVSKDPDMYGRYTIDRAAHEQNEWIDEGYEISDEEGERREEEAAERDEGNRRLIQAAPKLLTLLKEAQARIFVNYGNDDLYQRIDKAITEAEEGVQ